MAQSNHVPPLGSFLAFSLVFTSVSALSLMDAGLLLPFASTTEACVAAFINPIPGCTQSDFMYGCSASCIESATASISQLTLQCVEQSPSTFFAGLDNPFLAQICRNRYIVSAGAVTEETPSKTMTSSAPAEIPPTQSPPVGPLESTPPFVPTRSPVPALPDPPTSLVPMIPPPISTLAPLPLTSLIPMAMSPSQTAPPQFESPSCTMLTRSLYTSDPHSTPWAPVVATTITVPGLSPVASAVESETVAASIGAQSANIPIAAIVGGVLGGFVLLAAILSTVFYLLLRQLRRSRLDVLHSYRSRCRHDPETTTQPPSLGPHSLEPYFIPRAPARTSQLSRNGSNRSHRSTISELARNNSYMSSRTLLSRNNSNVSRFDPFTDVPPSAYRTAEWNHLQGQHQPLRQPSAARRPFQNPPTIEEERDALSDSSIYEMSGDMPSPRDGRCDTRFL